MSRPVDRKAITGATRSRFRLHWPWYVWLLPLALPVVIGGMVLLTGDLLATVISTVLVALLATLPVLAILASFQIRVTERALLCGAFLPGLAQEVYLYADIDPRTVRAWSNVRAYLRASGMPSLMTGGQINPGARGGISFAVRRVGRARGRSVSEDQMVADLGGTAEVMSVSGNPERLVRSLAAAMQDAGVVRAESVLAAALPPGQLSGAPGSHAHEIPGHPQPSQQRFEDLPPEMQERLRDRLRGGH